MKKLSPVFGAFLAAVVGGFLVFALQNSFYAAHQNLAEKPALESAYDRVMRTQTIRCGYVVWTPSLAKDSNSGQLSGIFYDYTEALGKALHLKIDWVEEEGWGDFPAALNSGRIDAMCGGSWPNAARARVIDFIRPIFYAPIYAWVRSDDTRFDNKLDAIDDPNIKIAFVEGTTMAVIAAQDFPKATTMQLPQMTSIAESFVNVVNGKVDVTLQSASAEHDYDVNNPGKLRRVNAKLPLRLGAQSLAINRGEDMFRRMLDLATDEMISSGQVEKILAKYDDVPGALVRVAPTYTLDNKQ
jgi:ABC-type amino acid transport substrate-binding protein